MPAKVLVSTEKMPYEKWLEYRKLGIGGSDASVVCGVSRYKSPVELWMEKTGQMPQQEAGEAAYWGTQLEALVRAEFTRRTGVEVRLVKQILQSEEHPFMLANLDGVCETTDHGTCIFEAKTASAYKTGEWDDTIPDEYMIQVQHYMAVTGYEGAYIAVLIGGNTFKWRFIPRDDELIAMLIELEAEFWNFSPSTIIMYGIPNGEISPKLYYQIFLTDRTGSSSVRTSGDSTDVLQKIYKNHRSYRASILPEISKKCRLFNEFENGTRDMEHLELFGILTNLLHVETGLTTFRNIMSRYPEIYDNDRLKRWADDSQYLKNHDYKPYSCENFCPYRNDCAHAKNILSTVRPKRWRMERLPEQDETFYSIEEAQDDVFTAISAALDARNDDIYVVRGQVGIGKSSSYLRLISENPTSRFLVAAPTNLLKDELYDKAKGMGIEVKRTPSLEQIKDEIPEDVWSHIQKFYEIGQHRQVYPYIRKVLEAEHIPCLEKYMEKREELKKYRGTLITTHRYLLNMEEKRLKEFDAVIVDEDILFKSVIANQEEIPVSKLNKILKKKTSKIIQNKINQLLDAAEKQTCIELGGFELDDDDGANYHIDMTSFCLAEHFFLRKESVEKGLPVCER